MVPAASGGKGERPVLCLKRDRLFRGGARAVASRGLYLPVEGYWFSNSFSTIPLERRVRAARNGREKDRERETEREEKENVRKRAKRNARKKDEIARTREKEKEKGKKRGCKTAEEGG